MEKEVAFLALTIAAELPVAMVVFGKDTWKRVAIAVVLLNIVTHPIAWHFALNGTPIIPIEIIVTLAESSILATLFSEYRSRAFAAGISMNIVSALIGIMFF